MRQNVVWAREARYDGSLPPRPKGEVYIDGLFFRVFLQKPLDRLTSQVIIGVEWDGPILSGHSVMVGKGGSASVV